MCVVVCEKPFTPTSQEADELNAIAKKNNKLLAVYQSECLETKNTVIKGICPLIRIDRRWDADFVTVSKLVKNGSLGRVVEYHSHFDRHRPEEPAVDASKWKNKVIPGGSAIYDLGTHLLDQAVHLLGLPNRITAFIGSQRESNTSGYDDSFTILLHYNNGVLVTVKAAVVSPEEEQLRFWVRGDKGSFKKVRPQRLGFGENTTDTLGRQYHLDIQEEQLKNGLKPGVGGYGREPSERYGGFSSSHTRYYQLYHILTVHPGSLTTIQNGNPVKEVVPTVEPPTWTEYYRKFARALGDEGELPASGAEAREVIRLIELAQESSKLGKTLDV